MFRTLLLRWVGQKSQGRHPRGRGARRWPSGLRPYLEVLEGRALPSHTVLALAGTPQSAVVTTAFAMPLQALIEDASGNPVGAGVAVDFSLNSAVGGQGGSFAGAVGVGTWVMVNTDANGIATATTLTANTHAGSYTAIAYVDGDPNPTPATFSLTNLPGAPANVVILAPTTTPGQPQVATQGTAFGTPFQVSVQDAYGNPVGAGTNVTFVAPFPSGISGTFPGGATTVTVPTDASGTATAPVFTAGNMLGGFVVTASAAGVATPVTFNMGIVGQSALLNVNYLNVGPAGAVGSILCTLPPTSPSTLTGLNSLTINAGPGDGFMNVALPASGPLLPGPITYNAAQAHNWVLAFDASAVSGANATFVTQPGAVVADGQPVLYNTAGVSFQFPTTAGVNAAVAPLYPTPGDAFITGYSDPHHRNPIYMTPPEHFVQVLYLDVLGRAGTVAEVDSWAALLNAGVSQTTVAAGIEGSFEARDRLVKTWYATYLGRPAQGGEEMGWVNLLQAGQTEEGVLSGLLGSAEFFDRAQTLVGPSGGLPAERYVEALYQVLLGRSASSAEVSGWNARVGVEGIQSVALDFLHSSEFRTDQFEGYYNVLLNRPGEGAALSGWVNANRDILDTRIAFEGSPEFYPNG
jgi:hypothetical protein